MDQFADGLVGRLTALPPTFIETVDYRVDQEEALRQRFGLLFLSVEDLKNILQRVKARIAWEKQNANPLLSMIDEPRAPAPPLDLSDIEATYSQHDGELQRCRNRYFQTPDQKL